MPTVLPIEKVKIIVQQWMDKKITLKEASQLTGKSTPTIRQYAKRLWVGEVIKQK